MAATKQLISTVTVGAGGASSIDFTSIPQGFTDLCITYSCRSDANPFGVAVNQIGVIINGGSTAVTTRALGGNGASSYSETGSGPVTQSSASTSSVFSNGQIYFAKYAGATNKSISTDSVIENNATNSWLALHAIQWPSTAAITSISLTNASGNHVQYSTASLYGITSGNGGATVS